MSYLSLSLLCHEEIDVILGGCYNLIWHSEVKLGVGQFYTWCAGHVLPFSTNGIECCVSGRPVRIFASFLYLLVVVSVRKVGTSMAMHASALFSDGKQSNEFE